MAISLYTEADHPNIWWQRFRGFIFTAYQVAHRRLLANPNKDQHGSSDSPKQCACSVSPKRTLCNSCPGRATSCDTRVESIVELNSALWDMLVDVGLCKWSTKSFMAPKTGCLEHRRPNWGLIPMYSQILWPTLNGVMQWCNVRLQVTGTRLFQKWLILNPRLRIDFESASWSERFCMVGSRQVIDFTF